jgi:hypothetical protein
MLVSFGKSAYVPGTPDFMLDTMENSQLSISGSYEGTVIVTRESVQKFLDNYKEDFTEAEKAKLKTFKNFLENSLVDIDQANDGTPIGDIFFIS